MAKEQAHGVLKSQIKALIQKTESHENKYARVLHRLDDFHEQMTNSQQIEENKPQIVKKDSIKYQKFIDEEKDPFAFGQTRGSSLSQALLSGNQYSEERESLRRRAEISQRRELVSGRNIDMTKMNYIMDDIKGMAEDAGTELMNQDRQILEADKEMQTGLDNAKNAVSKLKEAQMKKSDDTKKTWKIFVALLIIVLIAVAIMTSGGNTTNVNQIEITPA